MNVLQTGHPEVLILEPRVFQDERGWFAERYHRRRFESLGIPTEFVQDNHSHSQRWVLRGLHFQVRRPQAKLCQVVTGEVLDVAVDLRRSSTHYGRWVAVVLSASNRRQLFIPAGFAHGFLVRSSAADFLYKCSDYYAPDDEQGVAWNDPEIGIDWELPESVAPLLSPRDSSLPLLAELAPDQLPD